MLFLLVIVALLFVPVIRMFKAYCKRIAELERRTGGSCSYRTDDGGLNSFERENLSKILSRRYLEFGDVDLATLGGKLRYFLIAAYTAGVCYLGISIYVGMNICR